MESESRSVVSDCLRPHAQYSPWNSPGQNTGMRSRCLLQGIFPTQGLNTGPSHCRQILYQLSHQGSQILEWVAYPFSRRSSQPRNWTRVSSIAGTFFTSWATEEAQGYWSKLPVCFLLRNSIFSLLLQKLIPRDIFNYFFHRFHLSILVV